MEQVRRASPGGRRSEAFRVVWRIGMRNLSDFFLRKTIPLPGRLPTFDPGPPCALSVWWAGQATCLVGLGGTWLVTDPNFSPVIGRAVRRVVEAGFGAEDLPPITAAMVSHAHLDHLDFPSLSSLPGSPALLLPPGTGHYARRLAKGGPFREVREIGHWQGVEAGGVRITAVPAIHDGWRWGIDSLVVEAHASGYVMESAEATVYFTGDTSYDPELFREIGRRFSIDVLLCPIGPLEPRWLMVHFHVDPKDALRIFEDTGARHLLPIHHNTFVQSWDESTDPAAKFLDLRRNHPCGARTWVLRQGEQAIYQAREGGVALDRVRSPFPSGFRDPRIPGDSQSG